jgi:hypothetical protein
VIVDPDTNDRWAGPDGDSRTDYAALEYWEEQGYKDAWRDFLAHCAHELKAKVSLYVPVHLTLTKHGGAEFLQVSHGESRAFLAQVTIYAPWAGPNGSPGLLRDSRPALEHWEKRGYKDAWTYFVAHCVRELKEKAALYIPFRLVLKKHKGMEQLLQKRRGQFYSDPSYRNIYAPWVELDEATDMRQESRRRAGDSNRAR